MQDFNSLNRFEFDMNNEQRRRFTALHQKENGIGFITTRRPPGMSPTHSDSDMLPFFQLHLCVTNILLFLASDGIVWFERQQGKEETGMENGFFSLSYLISKRIFALLWSNIKECAIMAIAIAIKELSMGVPNVKGTEPSKSRQM